MPIYEIYYVLIYTIFIIIIVIILYIYIYCKPLALILQKFITSRSLHFKCTAEKNCEYEFCGG